MTGRTGCRKWRFVDENAEDRSKFEIPSVHQDTQMDVTTWHQGDKNRNCGLATGLNRSSSCLHICSSPDSERLITENVEMRQAVDVRGLGEDHGQLHPSIIPELDSWMEQTSLQLQTHILAFRRALKPRERPCGLPRMGGTWKATGHTQENKRSQGNVSTMQGEQ